MLIITSSSSLSIPQYPLSNPIFLLRNSQFLQISSRPTFLKLQHGNNNKICSRYMAVHAGVDPGSVVPPDPSSIPWKFWIVGMLITAILPFWNKFWPLTKLKADRVDSIVENVEEVAEGIENVAEGIDKVAEELADHLPEGGRLQKAAMFVEDAAEQAAKNAHLLDQFIDKLEAKDADMDEVLLLDWKSSNDFPISREIPNQDVEEGAPQNVSHVEPEVPRSDVITNLIVGDSLEADHPKKDGEAAGGEGGQQRRIGRNCSIVLFISELLYVTNFKHILTE
ncbi:uncharacterized protein [Euphorbia lathyris]|uniref:uncharacterized protein isoform X3 n=1 Tax=Euphorbia lathyris TaxID=212925 RepID=UPI003313D45E